MIMSNVIIGIFSAILIVIFGSIALGAAWTAGDQVIEMSDNQQLKNSYQTGKTMIITAEETKDNFAFLKSIILLGLIIGVPASIIKVIY